MAANHDGVIDASRAYTHKAIARILGQTDRWTVENVFRKGLKYAVVGRLYVTSGESFLQWVEHNSENFEGQNDARA